MIVCGEASGDMHGAALVRAMKADRPELFFSGMGGTELADAGVEILFDASRVSVVGITEVISHLGDILAARQTLIRQMEKSPPALLILIDFPDFNLWLANRARKLGIKIFYYISPQVWAWRRGRTKKIGKIAERIGVILPFEKDFYKQYGIEVDFVGHPLVDMVKKTMVREEFLKLHNIPNDNLVIGLLPGSRKKEIHNLLPDFLAAAELIHKESKKKKQSVSFLLPVAPTISMTLLKQNGLDEYKNKIDLRVLTENRLDLMNSCDAAVAASGTVTLELSILGIPTVATYRVSANTYRLGRLFVRNVKFFSLVNLIGGRKIIPELLQDEVTHERIGAEIFNLIPGGSERETVMRGFSEVRRKLGHSGTAERAAKIACQIIVEDEKSKEP
jgi:lipid-A-disaccharide synthase